MEKLQFRVKWKAEIKGEQFEGTEEEASWFCIDQRGGGFILLDLCNLFDLVMINTKNLLQ